MSYDPKTEILNRFEGWVVLAVARLGKDLAYGATIHEEVEKLSGRRIVSLGAIHTSLDRLEKKGMVSSKLSEPIAERGGRSKRLFRVEAAGEIALKNTIDQAAAMAAALRTARVNL